jgi:hypothetical protein
MVVDLAPVSGESHACLVRDRRPPLYKTTHGITVKSGTMYNLNLMLNVVMLGVIMLSVEAPMGVCQDTISGNCLRIAISIIFKIQKHWLRWDW